MLDFTPCQLHGPTSFIYPPGIVGLVFWLKRLSCAILFSDKLICMGKCKRPAPAIQIDIKVRFSGTWLGETK